MEFVKPFFIIISGQPGSGKSSLIKYIMLTNNMNFTKSPFQYGVVFSNTSFKDSFNYIPSKYVHGSYKPEILQNLMEIQKEHYDKSAFVVFDDCLPAKAFTSQLFVDLSTTYRHWNISVIISSQYIYRISPTIRECSKYAIMFRTTTQKSIKALFDSFGTFFKNYEEFKTYLISNTEDNHFIIMDRLSFSNNRDEIYHVFKAPDPTSLLYHR